MNSAEDRSKETLQNGHRAHAVDLPREEKCQHLLTPRDRRPSEEGIDKKVGQLVVSFKRYFFKGIFASITGPTAFRSHNNTVGLEKFQGFAAFVAERGRAEVPLGALESDVREFLDRRDKNISLASQVKPRLPQKCRNDDRRDLQLTEAEEKSRPAGKIMFAEVPLYSQNRHENFGTAKGIFERECSGQATRGFGGGDGGKD